MPTKHYSVCPYFIYTFQDEGIECYENYLKYKKDFSFTVVEDLETTTGYISEIDGGYVCIVLLPPVFSISCVRLHAHMTAHAPLV